MCDEHKLLLKNEGRSCQDEFNIECMWFSGVLTSNEKSCVCNVFATPHFKNPVKSSVPSYLNVNRWNNSIRFIASQDASEPLRTFVLGGFLYIFIENCGRILSY